MEQNTQLGEDRGAMQLIPTALVMPSPLNPRKHFDQAGLEELAESIRTHGQQQPIVVRPRTPEPGRYDYSIAPADAASERYGILDTQQVVGEHWACVTHVTGHDAAAEYCKVLNNATYEIIMGERRWRACHLARITLIKAIVRCDVTTDRQVLELALIENLHRRDIDAIEEAQGYKRLAELGYKQTEIAKKVNRSQPSVANALRLLQLPDDVQELVAAGKLGVSHVLPLLRYADFPAVVSAAATYIAEQGISSHDLELDHGLPGGVQVYLQDKHRIQMLRRWQKPFDWEAICHTCPFSAYRVIGRGSSEICLRPDHYQQLADEAVAKSREEAEQAQRELQAKAAQMSTKAQAALKSSGVVSEEAGKEDTPKALCLKDLPYNSYEQLYTSRVEGCSESCPCRAKALNHNNALVEICLDTSRLKQLRVKETKAKNAEKKAKFDEMRKLFRELAKQQNPVLAKRIFVVMVWSEWYSLAVSVKREVANRTQNAALKELLCKNGYEVKTEEAYAVLEAADATELTFLLGEVLMQAELKQSMESGYGRADKTEFMVGVLKGEASQ